ncbi:MAG: hypothetical protein ACFFCS_03620 [Candidatus Hodarchaeota archaeon]
MTTEFIDWNNLKNPVYEHPGWSVKDACMIFHDGYFYIFFSAFYKDEGRERSHVCSVKTRDFKQFSEPLFDWRGKKEGWIGLCSPNISKTGNLFYLTYNSWGDKRDKTNQLFCATSKNFEDWEYFHIALELTLDIRAIDAAIAFDDGRFILSYKEKQRPKMGWTDDIREGPWHEIGLVAGGLMWMENTELIKIDGKWHVVCTMKSPHPMISQMDEDEAKNDEMEKWLAFADFKEMVVPREKFNTHSHANAPFLADWRQHDGYFYLLYAGNTEGITHKRRGDNRLGLARSRDLETWEVPGHQ